jgi:serine phosphatase RsbU (regulator of sigma subunit)
VEERTKEVVKQKNRIEKQNKRQQDLLENIRASIRYAKRLQDNILPSEEYIAGVLPNSFIFFKPKDIVSGDFYFVQEIEGKVVIACVDCTGHGVPGAFMSLVGHNALKHALARNLDLNPAKILRDLSDLSAEALNRHDADGGGRDGMDIALCVYDRDASELEYCGAFCPLYIVRGQSVFVTTADKIAIASVDGEQKEFTRHTIPLNEGDMVYLFSDGYADQFGGSKGRKFMYSAFRQLLLEVSELPLKQQRKKLSTTFDSWRSGPYGILEQVDDILVMGLRHEKA